MKEFLKNKYALTDKGAADLVKSSVASFLALCVNMMPMLLLMFYFDSLINEKSLNSPIFYVASIGTLILLYVFLGVEYDALYNATFRESENLRIDIARKLRKLPLHYFSKHDLSDLAQTIMSDVATIEHALSHAIPKCIGFAWFFIIISIMLLSGNLILGLCTIIPVLLFFAMLFLSKKINIIRNGKYYDKLRENSERFQEAIELQQEIKSFNMDAEIGEELNREVEMGEKTHIQAEFVGATITSFAALILHLSYVMTIIVGIRLLTLGEINLLYLIGYLMASMKLKDAVDGVALNIMECFFLTPTVERIRELAETPVQEGENTELTDFDIKLENVSFSYDSDTRVLEDVSFTAKQGQVTALVGRSGCGKTSILRLISRLYDYDRGLISISGKDIKSISTESLFKKVSVVFQDVTLFNTSIMENIRLGNIDATDEEVKHAAELAGCLEFIEKLPDGYHSVIGENGTSLSGGERQRISIARAFLKNAPIVILDEIAASLDTENEKKIQESLNRLIAGKTVLIISHRLKSIENVDKIVVIDRGRVESEGTHSELIASSEVYKDLILKTKLAEGFVY